MAEDQEERNTEIAKIHEQMAKAQEDIDAENNWMVQLRTQIQQETEGLRMEAWRIGLRQHASEAVHRRRHESHLPPGFEPTRLFNTPGTGTSTPAAPIIPQLNRVVPHAGDGRSPAAQPHQPTQHHQLEPAQHASPVRTTPDRFVTPAGHFSNPVDDLLAEATNLTALPITGYTPVEREALQAIELLKTAVAQHANYSYSRQRLHSTPHQSHSRSRHAESPAVSSNARRIHEQQCDPPHLEAQNA